MYFSDYKQHPVTAVKSSLLWEYDLTNFDYQAMRRVVVQRVIERGWPNDFYAIFNLYGEDGVKQAIKELPYLNAIDMNFVSVVFDIPLNQLQCYEKRPLRPQHWNS
jgi:hypothetical protein